MLRFTTTELAYIRYVRTRKEHVSRGRTLDSDTLTDPESIIIKLLDEVEALRHIQVVEGEPDALPDPNQPHDERVWGGDEPDG